MAIEHAKNTLFGGGKNRHTPLDREKPKPKYSAQDMAAYEAYKKDFAADVATGKYGATDRKALSQDLAHRIGYKSPSQSKLALKSASRGHGRADVDPNTGRSATRALTASDRAELGLGDDFVQRGQIMSKSAASTPVPRKKNPKRDSAKKASKGKASAQYYSYGLSKK